MKKSFILVFFIALLVPTAITLIRGKSSNQGPSEMQLFSGPERQGLMNNPEFSLWEKMMCFGHRRSAYCPDVPLHPIEEKKKEMGLEARTGQTPKRNATMKLEDIVIPR